MADNRKFSDFEAAIAAALSLGLAVAVAALLKAKAGIQDAPIIITLLILPLLVYGVVSGRIRELHAPGGWLAKFDTSANTGIQSDILPIEPILVQKDFVEHSIETLRKRPNALKLILQDGAVDLPICDYIDSLLASPAFRYVVFVNSAEDFVGIIPISSIAAELTPGGDCRSRDLIQWIVTEQFEEVGKVPGFIWRKNAASPDWSKRRCLEEMQNKGIDLLPVVGKDNKLQGVIEKGQLVSSLIVDVAARLRD